MVISMKNNQSKILYSGAIYTAAIAMNIFAFGIMGWNY